MLPGPLYLSVCGLSSLTFNFSLGVNGNMANHRLNSKMCLRST